MPQGSVLGPTLFLLFVNDIADNIQSTVRLFADDCLIYRVIHSPDDHNILQNDLDKLTDWAEEWQMEFNVAKCNIMQITTRLNISKFNYTMYTIPLQIVNQHKYLGVCLDHKMSWQPHINQICAKTNRLIGFLHRNLKYCSRKLKELAYQQILLPCINYCSTIWDPHHQNAIDKLEMIQHRAARFILNKPWRRNHQDSITEMLSDLSWPTLKSQRKSARLILLFKLLNDLVYIPTSYKPTTSNITTTRRHHSNKLNHYQTSTDIYRYSFFPRTVPEWNNLQLENLSTIRSVTAFKTALSHLH